MLAADAWPSVASALLTEVARASLAAMGRCRNNTFGTCLGTTATCLSACAPCTPGRFDNAVNRACLCVARGVLLFAVAERACFAVVVLRRCDSVRARLRAAST